MSRIQQITALGAVLLLALAAMTGAVSAEAGYYVDESDVSSDDNGTYSTTINVSDEGAVDGASITGLEFDNTSDTSDDITVYLENSSGDTIASDTHTGLDPDLTHDLTSEFNAHVNADEEYTLVVESASGNSFTADAVELDGIAVESTDFVGESVDVAPGNDYTKNVTLLNNERITEVSATNFTLTGDNLSSGAEVNVTFEVTNSSGDVVDSGTHTVTEGNATDLTQAIDMDYAGGDEEYTLTVSADNSDAGFEADEIAISGETPQDGGSGSGSDGVSGNTAIIILVVAGVALFLAARD